jgi:serine/threonine protein kinase
MNVVHRDLKPENLILKLKDNDSELLIADFGLAAILENSEQLLARRCGSPGFIAPELLDDKGYNCMADVFSAGSIMYMMLSGRLAFRGVGVDDILRKNKDCVVEYPE